MSKIPKNVKININGPKSVLVSVCCLYVISCGCFGPARSFNDVVKCDDNGFFSLFGSHKFKYNLIVFNLVNLPLIG